MSPVDYHGWTHAPKSAGGTDPIPDLGGGLSHAWIMWNNSSVSINANTWTGIDTADAFNQDFGDGFESEPNPHGLTVDLTNDTAQIGWDGTGTFNWHLVLVSAWVEWSDTGFTDGDEIGVGIILGLNGTGFNSPRYINTVPVGGDDPDIENEKIPVSVIVPGSFNKNCARVQVWQSSAGAKNCANVFLSVLGLMEPGGTFYP